MLKNYSLFSKVLKNDLNESAPRIPNDENYWKKKGKKGKEVALYFHDDLDGIYSAIAMKGYLEKKNFDIVQYGIVNYQEGWTTTVLDPELINIALDYAENIENIDVYIDHHGEFKEGENEGAETAVKTKTSSAYEGIMDQLGLPVDSTVVNVIDMVDSAKYDDYNIDIKNIITFDFKDFKNKLEFAAAFNQLLKRSDHKTFIEVVANTKDINPSIYNVFRLFRILYPANNLDNREIKKLAIDAGFTTPILDNDGSPVLDRWNKPKVDVDIKGFIKAVRFGDENKGIAKDPKMLRDFEKDFLDDAQWRLGQMASRTWGGDQEGAKQYVDSQETFKQLFCRKGKGGNDKVSMPGYQIIGNMCFVPSGTWANALRARAILEKDLLVDERIPVIQYIVTKDSPLYKDLKEKDGQNVELVGDIKKSTATKASFNAKQDVTGTPEIEGIKGVIHVKDDEVIFEAKQPIFWILLQYGNTLQVASLHKFDLYVKEYLPKLKDGSTVENLGKYCEDLLCNFIRNFGYNKNYIPEMTTKAGGHKGIGSISNVFGEVQNPDMLLAVEDCEGGKQYQLPDSARKIMKNFQGVRFLDLIKNKMISDLSGVKFDDLRMQWGDPDEKPAPKPRKEDMNKKVLKKEDIRKAQDVEKQYKDWAIEDISRNKEEVKKMVDQYGVEEVARIFRVTTKKLLEILKELKIE